MGGGAKGGKGWMVTPEMGKTEEQMAGGFPDPLGTFSNAVT